MLIYIVVWWLGDLVSVGYIVWFGASVVCSESNSWVKRCAEVPHNAKK